MLVNRVGWFGGKYCFDFSDEEELSRFVDYLEDSCWNLIKSEEAIVSGAQGYLYIYEKGGCLLEITLDKLGFYKVSMGKFAFLELRSFIIFSINELVKKIPLFSHKKSLRFLKKQKKTGTLL